MVKLLGCFKLQGSTIKKKLKTVKKSLFMLTSQSDTLKDDFFLLLFLQPSKITKSQWYEDEKGNSIF